MNFFTLLIKFFFSGIYKKLENRKLEKNEKILLLNAKQLIAKQNTKSNKINDYEFSVFSQWGEDGIINHLINNLDIKSKNFIEFGVENYLESNTRFILQDRNWSGLILDSDKKNISEIKTHYYFWKHDLKACLAHITAENINNLIEVNNFNRPIGILSIDVDGNDYWIWKNLNLIQPDIVVIEYNYRFGKSRSVTIPYDPNFDRKKAHSSMVYYGSSLLALNKLANQKNMKLVGTNLSGNNAFFVKETLLNDKVKETEVSECFREGKFRELRDEKGNLLFVSSEEEKKIINNIPLEEV